MFTKDFFMGWLFCGCIYSIYQDILGKETYIYYLQNYWMSSYISLPLALIVLGGIFYYYIKKDKK